MIGDANAGGMKMVDRCAISRERFEYSLRIFVENYAPEDPYERDEFQRGLMLIMRDAMQSQSDAMALGIEHYASDQFRALAMHPLNAIFEKPKGEGP